MAEGVASRRFWRRHSLLLQVLAGVGFGTVLGAYAPHLGAAMEPFATAFLKLVQMLIGPIIFCTIVQGIAGAGSLRMVGRVAVKTLLYFELVTTAALIIGFLVINALHPGSGMHVNPAVLHADAVQSLSVQARHPAGLMDFLLDLIPSSPLSGFLHNNILQILVFSVLFACGLQQAGEVGAPVAAVVNGLANALFKLIAMVMKLAPLAAFGAMAYGVGQFGFVALLSVGKLAADFYLACLLFVLLVLLPIAIVARIRLWPLILYFAEELLLVFGTTSSEMVFPQLSAKMTALGVEERIVSLVLPAAYSFNHEGTSLYCAASALFLAQAIGAPLDMAQQLSLFGLLLLTTKGAAGVSGAALVVLAGTLAAFQTIPLASIALILGIHRILASAFTVTNIIGDCVAILVIAHWEKAIDRDRMSHLLG